MKRSTFKYIEDILRDYTQIDHYIEAREMELRYPIKHDDENVGGGRSNEYKEHQTDILITIDDDKRLNGLKRERDVIDDCLDEAGQDTEIIIKELYFKRRPELTIDGLITNGLIHVSHTQAFNLRNKFIENVGHGLDIPDF